MDAIPTFDHFGEPKHPEQDERLGSHECILDLRQEPRNARVAVGKEKDRKPIDPPPIIQLKARGYDGASATYLQNPHVFMSCTLLGQNQNDPFPGSLGTSLAGTLVSSLHRLKDLDNAEGCFFIFHDLSVKIEGIFRLRFTLHEIIDNYYYAVKEIISIPFTVHSTKNFPGMAESTFLTRTFGDQGMRVRLRKEPRALLRKRGPAHDDYQPRHYTQRSSNNRNSSAQDDERQNETADVQHHRQAEPDLQQTHAGYEQRSTQRHYSTASHPDAMPYNESNKRHRTNSESSHASPIGQQLGPLDAVSYPLRYYTEPQQPFSGYSPQPPQTAPYGNPYIAPSQINARDQYFPQKLETSEAPLPYHLQVQRAPVGYYYPTASLPLHYPQSTIAQHSQSAGSILAPSSPHRIETAQDGCGGLGFGRENPTSGVDISNMSSIAPMYGSMHGPATTYAPMSTSIPIKRESYQSYPLQPQSYSNGMPPGLQDPLPFKSL